MVRYLRVETDNRFRRGGGAALLAAVAKSTDRIHQLVGITKVIPSGSIDLRVLIAII